MTPALFWQGAFMDAKRHWTDRGNGPQPPLGYDIFKVAPAGQSLAILPETNTPWPVSGERPETLQFRGYRLDAKRFPTFHYETGSVKVEESYQPAGEGRTNDLRVTRTLKFKVSQPAAHLHFRAAAGPLKAEGAQWTGDGFRISADQGQPFLRGNELLVPVVFTGDTATVAVTYHWNP